MQKLSTYISYLQHHPLFQKSSLQTLKTFASHLQLEDIPLGNIISTKKNQKECLTFIFHGSIKLMQIQQKNVHKTLDLLGFQDFFGVICHTDSIIENKPQFFMAHSPVKILRIDIEVFKNFYYSSPEIQSKFHEILHKRYSLLHHTLAAFGAYKTKTRIARTLIYLLHKCGNIQSTKKGHLQYKVTHKLISEFIGTSRESVTKTLQYFKKQEIIQYSKRGQLVISNIDSLFNIARS